MRATRHEFQCNNDMKGECMQDELSTKVMASLVKSKALAGSIWRSKKGGTKHKITGYGLEGNDVIINYRLCKLDPKGGLKEDSLQRIPFLRGFTLI